MKYKVERCLECDRSWVVIGIDGHVMFETVVWQWAVDDAISRYRSDLMRRARALSK